MVVRCGAAQSVNSEGRFHLRLDRHRATSSLNIDSVSPQDEGRYVCKIYRDTKLMSAGSHLVLMDISPSDVELVWSNQTELLESSPHQQLTVNCSSSGYPLPRVSWTKDGAIDPIGTGVGFSVLSFTSVNRRISGMYVCQSNNSIPPVKNKSAVIHVLYPPNITELYVVSTNQTKVGNPNYIKCIVDSHPAADVKWKSMGNSLIDADNMTDVSTSPFNSIIESRLALAGIANGESYASKEYTCMATNQFGTAERTVSFSEDIQATKEAESKGMMQLLLIGCAAVSFFGLAGGSVAAREVVDDRIESYWSLLPSPPHHVG
ncbi:lachesin-like [Diadema setosum]|uniref:lachesin-like n=1 Tax=Diadema setosum TaxID=31175 RepID=UPI003B3AD7A1